MSDIRNEGKRPHTRHTILKFHNIKDKENKLKIT